MSPSRANLHRDQAVVRGAMNIPYAATTTTPPSRSSRHSPGRVSSTSLMNPYGRS